MFSNAKVGDSVWSFVHGTGQIIYIVEGSRFPIRCRFSHETFWFTLDGKESTGQNQTLFWYPIEYETPKRKVHKWIPVVQSNQNPLRLDFGTSTYNSEIAARDHNSITIGAVCVTVEE